MTTTRNRTRQRDLSHRRRERAKPSLRSTILVSLVVLLALLAIPGVGYYEVFIAPLREPVVRVNDTTFNMGDYIERLRIQSLQNKLVSLPMDMSTEPFRVLDILRDDELIRQYALTFGINVTREQVDRALRAQLQPPRKEGEQASEDELNREFEALYRKRLSDLMVSDQDYRKLITAQLMRDIMRERLSDRVPTVTDQVRVRTLAVEDEAQLAEVQKRLKNGDDFGVVAKELSKDDETRRQGGDLGWVPRRVRDRPFDEYAYKLETGAVSEPFTYMTPRRQDEKEKVWLIQVTDRAEARQVDEKAKEKLKDRALEDWLDEQREANLVERFFDSNRYEFAIRKVAEFGAREQQKAGQQPGAASS